MTTCKPDLYLQERGGFAASKSQRQQSLICFRFLREFSYKGKIWGKYFYWDIELEPQPTFERFLAIPKRLGINLLEEVVSRTKSYIEASLEPDQGQSSKEWRWGVSRRVVSR